MTTEKTQYKIPFPRQTFDINFQNLGKLTTPEQQGKITLTEAISIHNGHGVAALVEASVTHKGCVYLRLQRKPAPILYSEGEKFELGKAKVLRKGSADGKPAQAVIVALGALMVGEALKAADVLAAEGMSVAVIDALSLKPLDDKLILEWAEKTGRIITCDNHQKRGALGSAVAEVLAESGKAFKFARIGVNDEFGEVGTQDWLAERYKLTAPHIAAAIKAL